MGWFWDFSQGIQPSPPGFGAKILKIEAKSAVKSEKPPDHRIQKKIINIFPEGRLVLQWLTTAVLNHTDGQVPINSCQHLRMSRKILLS